MKSISYGILVPISLFFEYLGIKNEPFLILSILLIIDMFTGIAKQYSINPSDISSRKSMLWVLKKIVILLIPICIALVTKVIDINLIPVCIAVTTALILSEFYSILGNISCILTGQPMKEYDAISAIITKLMSSIEIVIEKFLK